METDPREEKGRNIARAGRIRQVGNRWAVPSQTAGTTGYVVDLAESTCTCPDFDLRRLKCKHQHAVEFYIVWQANPDGSVSETMTIRRTYSQPSWPAYHVAQVHEREHVEALLHGLCDGIQQPDQRMGRPRLPLRDLVYAVVSKVYGTMSGRRAQTDLRNCHARGLLTKAPHYNSVFRAFESPSITPILTALIEEAALPLREFERQFAQDATGFSTTTYDRWFDEMHGTPRAQRPFVKLHAMVGTKTNVVTCARVTSAGDSPMLAPMLQATVNAGFTVAEVSADKAYLSHDNVNAIRALGAIPYIPFKENSSGRGPELWREMFAFFMLRRPEFLPHYHRRSNVEATFAMIKAKFGGTVRSKLPVAQANEVLAKVLCHNLCCLVSAFYETGRVPPFWRERAAAPAASPA